MNKINDYIRKLFTKIEKIDCSAKQEEMVDGQAFTYTNKFFGEDYKVLAHDTITCGVDGMTTDGKKCNETISQEIGENCTINSVAIFRAKEAFGMTNVIGGAFGYKERHDCR